MLIQRSAALGAAFLVVTLLAVLCAPQGWVPAAAARSATDPVERLRREADKAREDLEKATKKWESGKKELAKSQEKLRRTLRCPCPTPSGPRGTGLDRVHRPVLGGRRRARAALPYRAWNRLKGRLQNSPAARAGVKYRQNVTGGVRNQRPFTGRGRSPGAD